MCTVHIENNVYIAKEINLKVENIGSELLFRFPKHTKMPKALSKEGKNGH